jgi:CRP-like cAMP-binding protein
LFQHTELLRKLVFSFAPMDEAAFEALCAAWTEINVPRKHVMTRQGETEKYLYLVLDGIQRAYCIHNDKEATLVFSYTPSFSGIVDSFLLQRPSSYYLETITKSTFLRMHHNDFAALIEKYPAVDRWVRIAVTHVLAGTLQRQIELLSYSAEEKFTALLSRSPHILNMVPHKYLASYIGIDATNFSKLLGKVRLT